MQWIWIALILITPYILGFPFRRIFEAKNRLLQFGICYVAGYFIRLAIFHVICFPMVLFQCNFTLAARIFAVVLLTISSLIIVLNKKEIITGGDLGKAKCGIKTWIKSHTRYEFIYLMAFLAVFAFQLYQVVRMDITYMGYDDATYATYGSDALETDTMFLVDEMTGVSSILYDRKAFMTALIYNAWITRMTGIPITMVERTVQPFYILLLAYTVYAYMAEDLIKKRENRYIFLLLLSLLYLFGYYSHYSATFRLLGPSAQGKAIATTILTPFVFVLLRKKLASEYDWKFGLFLLILSNAATGLSLWGMGMFVATTTLLTILMMFTKERRWRNTLYLLWANVFPVIYLVIYIVRFK